MRIHLLGLPNAPVHPDFCLDGFAMATHRFATMMTSLGHEVLLYGAEGSEAACAEFIQVITDEERTTLLGQGEYQHAAMNDVNALWLLSNPRMARAIAERKRPRDFICLIGGASQQPVTDAHPDLMAVEYSIGYQGSYAAYRVFESHVWRHWTYAWYGQVDGRFYDTVIPCFFDPEEFVVREQREPFLLYCGRIVPKKGVTIACETARRAGLPLKLIGHGDPSIITYGDYLGALPQAEKNDWLSRAMGVFTPTTYIEPFCCVAVEAQLCGTPVISTDYGAFVETVEQGMTGYRCTYLGEFIDAVRRLETLDPAYIRKRAVEKYSMHNLKHDYQRYFDKLLSLWDEGWNTPTVLG